MIHGLELFDFQSECSDYIKNYCLNNVNKKTLVVKAPTGSGKTIILLDFIDKYNYEKQNKVAYIWLTPGSGELEEQSRNQMILRLPQYTSKDLDEALSTDFEDRDVCFINWERVTKKGNRAIIDAERKNIFEKIAEAHLSGIRFVLIIDEEHSNNTSKAKDIIDAFAPVYTIRVSATAQNNNMYDYYEINEGRVISSGLITRAIYINEGIDQKQINDEHALLLNMANNKRKEVLEEYQNRELDINPLVIIQLPNENNALIKHIEDKLEDLDVTYDNKRLAIWLSEKKENIKDITNQNNTVQFLMIKQAISTGWDCPRAKILVKLRERMNEDFEIQTVGRIRRMPQAKHYNNEVLDNSYLYTFDEKYKRAVVENIGNAYDVRRIFLKKEFKKIKLTKQLANRDIQISDEREVREEIRSLFVNKYNLDNNIKLNRSKLETAGYVLKDTIVGTVAVDKIVQTEDIVNDNVFRYTADFGVNTSNHAIDLRQQIDSFKSYIGLSYEKTRAILQMLFRDNTDYFGQKRESKKLLNLNTIEFYAFILNNSARIREEFRDSLTGRTTNLNIQFTVKPREEEFKLPHEETFKYVPDKSFETISNNVYSDYTDECLIDPIRSLPERLFERWCMNNADWYYKNGDSGQQYFSIVYVDGINRQHLFYADYILQINGELWIIETKGGENSKGESRNIDKQIANKFEAFKQYASQHDIKWGFVRDKNEKLYINNTVYSENLSDDNWLPINSILK